jgi:hypothetical protein
VIIAQGGVTGGRSLYAKDGKPVYCYNFFGLERYYIDGIQEIPEGQHQVRVEFAYDGGGIGKGGVATLFVDGAACGSGRIEQTEAFLFSADETLDVRDEFGSPVTAEYPQRKFSGTVNWVEVGRGHVDHTHLIKPEDRVKLAMGIQ